jgi:hypothetical protein
VVDVFGVRIGDGWSWWMKVVDEAPIPKTGSYKWEVGLDWMKRIQQRQREEA